MFIHFLLNKNKGGFPKCRKESRERMPKSLRVGKFLINYQIMKKYFILVLVLVTCVSAINAQFSQFHVGLALPQGDFGDGNEKKEFFMSDGVGFAATGFNIGYKYYNPLSVEKLSLVFGLDVFYNGLNSDAKDEWGDDDADISWPAYLNIPVTIGLNYAHPINEAISIYGEFALGVNFSKITNFHTEYSDDDYQSESTYKYDAAFTFCYGLEAGVFINKKFSIGLRYNQLGSHKFKGKKEWYYEQYDDEGDDKFKFGKALSISNLSLSVGILF
jgi:opacity protein-like surface antigen